MADLLRLIDVCKDYEGLRAVDKVSLTVPEESVVGLIGPNGSGKSSLINVISGNTSCTSGKIFFDDHEITNKPSNQIFDYGLVRGFQNPALFFQMTVLDNVLLAAKSQHGENPWFAPLRSSWLEQERENIQQARGILERLKLDLHYNVVAAELSGGQMKLLELARALMSEPKMLLLDEPTAGVAPGLAYEIFEHIAALRDELGLTVLVVEHRLEILFDFADDVYVMHMGKLIAHGKPDEIQQNDMVREVYFGD